MGIKNDKFFYLMLLGDGYAVLDESGNPALVGEGTIVEVIKYLQRQTRTILVTGRKVKFFLRSHFLSSTINRKT